MKQKILIFILFIQFILNSILFAIYGFGAGHLNTDFLFIFLGFPGILLAEKFSYIYSFFKIIEWDSDYVIVVIEPFIVNLIIILILIFIIHIYNKKDKF